MSHTAQAPPASGSPPGEGPSKRAPRGAACLNCRRRKMRCDGARPICGQCIRTNREIDCEYTDGPGPSPTQILEEQIARLESRIRELEHPELVPPSVTLNPATAAALRTQSPSAITGSIGSAGRSLLGRVVTPDALSAAMPSAAVPVLSQDPLVEPPVDLVRNLVNAFLQHSASLSFFLHVPRFMQAMQQPSIDNRRVQLSPALLNAVYLWGAHLSTSAALRAYESIFQVRATNALSSALRESQYSVINLIQAEVLMANYFFTMSRFLEGRYHCSAAVALALSCRLHKIRSSTDQGFGLASMRQGEQVREYNLPPPRDAVEEGERMRGFWYVYAMDKNWAVALGSPSHFNGIAQSGSYVDTPWPLETAQYEAFYGRFVAVDGLIDRFSASLPPINRSSNAEVALNLLVTHTLAHAATIQLRSNFKAHERMNDGKDFVAAQAAARSLEGFNVAFNYVDPILADPSSPRTYAAVAASASSSSARAPAAQREAIRATLDRVLAAMNRFRETCPLMGMLHDGFVSVQGAM
ncbi:hypothetical protein FKP32DRAFT_1610151 [Trametes sanguinea]|nr:hypothetical protein FKP32DRAFT_1610151 [Trametes sanguinea]